MATPSRSTVETLTQKAVTELKDWVKSQKPLWQKVPWLALQADGRTGYDDNYRLAYKTGYWFINVPGIRRYSCTAVLNLAEGELLNPRSWESFTRKESQDSELLDILRSPDVVDAGKIIAKLEAAKSRPYLSMYDAEEQDAWREELRQKHDVEETFVR